MLRCRGALPDGLCLPDEVAFAIKQKLIAMSYLTPRLLSVLFVFSCLFACFDAR